MNQVTPRYSLMYNEKTVVLALQCCIVITQVSIFYCQSGTESSASSPQQKGDGPRRRALLPGVPAWAAARRSEAAGPSSCARHGRPF